MEEKKAIIMVGKKSSPHSVFAVFENFGDWKQLQQEKVIPNGFYFAVLKLDDKIRADIYPDLFVQGYRPHSSGAQIHVDKRRYGKFVEDEGMRVAKDDLVFSECQLYQIIKNREVELVLSDKESQVVSGVEKLVQRICMQQSLTVLSDILRYRYHCPESTGYFLKGRSYDVWFVLVGKNEGLFLKKEVLVIDYLTGIPAIVPYTELCFETISDGQK